ncbi:hypothetical protein QR680_015824 [Steinernema hermaphroditum]|uniref:7TM GPCR serpentine receptor class x (Srx) domain-containing protein n=1 Tax=Steinernema hermaphroditum TaxID=289476 RepID=A0AA39HBM2_9BILA|nr:hypothetical protein QR680_015824 [Steinernema hermaphroditum]
MELMLFRHDEYRKLYNCSYKTDEEWWSIGKPNIPLGVAFIAIGVIMTMPYIPCLIVMVKSRLYRWAGYKIMLYVGVMDIMCLCVSGPITGMLATLGAVSCPYIDVEYAIGNLGVAMWASQSMSVVLLAFNRCVEMWKPKYLYDSFEGHRTYFWLLGCTLYSMIFVVYAPGLTFSATAYAWFYDPYKNVPGLDFIERTQYVNKYHFLHNIFIVVALPAMYIFLCVSLWWKSRRAGGNISKVQKIMTVQAFFLCLFTFLSAFIYDYMQFYPVPASVSIGVNVTWQMSNGAPAIIYLIVNKTIRNGVIALVLGNRVVKEMITPSIAPMRSTILSMSKVEPASVM